MQSVDETDVDDADQGIFRAIDEELRRARDKVGWSCPQLVAHLQADMPVNTYAFPGITSDPDVLNGLPCIRDLHIPVSTVMKMLANGMSSDDIVAGFPGLTAEDVAEARHYAAHDTALVRAPTTPSRSFVVYDWDC